MKPHWFWTPCLAVLASAACAAPGRVGPASANASAAIRDASGRLVGTASLRQGHGLSMRVEARGLPQGSHGVHIHSVGRCEPPSFDSAGPHWNPIGRQHGSLNPQGPHQGDLPNLVVGADGNGVVEFTVSSATLRGDEQALLDDDGAALVVHANADDYRTDPSGNSGARIACGVVE